MGCLFSANKESDDDIIYRPNNNTNNKTNNQVIKTNNQVINTNNQTEIAPELLNILNKNTIKIQKRFYEVLYRNISETDGNGFIYGFTKDNDYTWIKIGRTVHANPNKRVEQWKGDILFCQKTKNNKKIETLIHLLFKNKNIHRKNEKTGSKEIEWFYFEEYINVTKILAILIEYVDVDLHCNNTIT